MDKCLWAAVDKFGEDYHRMNTPSEDELSVA